jgi:hypothetical protein
MYAAEIRKAGNGSLSRSPMVVLRAQQRWLSIAMLDYGHVLTMKNTGPVVCKNCVCLRGPRTVPLLVVSGIWVPPKNEGCSNLALHVATVTKFDKPLDVWIMGLHGTRVKSCNPNGWVMDG